MFFLYTYSFETEGQIEGKNTGKFGEYYDAYFLRQRIATSKETKLPKKS